MTTRGSAQKAVLVQRIGILERRCQRLEAGLASAQRKREGAMRICHAAPSAVGLDTTDIETAVRKLVDFAWEQDGGRRVPGGRGMTHHEYWIEVVTSSLGEHCIEVGDLAIVAVADDMKIASEQQSMAFGCDVASGNMTDELRGENTRLKTKWNDECAKVWCTKCGGGKDSKRHCWTCDGAGYVDP